MIDKFIDHLNGLLPLDAQDIALLKKHVEVQAFKRGDVLLAAGQVSTSFFFNLKGFVRLFYLKDGAEKTAYFYNEGKFISAYESFVKQEPCAFSFQAMEETAVVNLSVEASQVLLAHSPKFEILARVAMEEELIAHQKVIQALLTMTPEERYYHLIKANPEIMQRVPQRYIAEYIGVQPESLSRIKKRYMTRNLNQSQ